MEDTIQLTTAVSVRSEPPPIPNYDEDQNGNPVLTWEDRAGNPIPEDRPWGGYFMQFQVPVVVRRSDIQFVRPYWDDMSEYIGDPPSCTEVHLRGSSYPLRVTEDFNTVLSMLGWGEVELPKAYPRHYR